jgi:hypothetical protein
MAVGVLTQFAGCSRSCAFSARETVYPARDSRVLVKTGCRALCMARESPVADVRASMI